MNSADNKRKDTIYPWKENSKLINNNKINDITKMKESFDEVKSRFIKAKNCKDKGLYNQIIGLSNKLDEIINKSKELK